MSTVIRHGLLRLRRPLMLSFLVLMLVVTFLAPRIFITVPSGYAGVLWLRFFGGGTIVDHPLREGLHIIFPWDHVYLYDMRMQVGDETYQIISKEGLQFSVRLNFRWRLNPNRLAELHRTIGPNYLNVLIAPEIGSVTRARIANFTAQDLLSGKRAQVQKEIYMYTVTDDIPNNIGSAIIKGSQPSPDSVLLVDILLKDVVLPPRLKEAIERKLEQGQIVEEYEFRIQRERLESERKKIEAEGIQAFQQTVTAGISDAYLKWRGIEATLQLATSDNAKVIVIGGGGSEGLPLILNTGDSPAPSTSGKAASSNHTQDVNRSPLSSSLHAPASGNASDLKDANHAELNGSLDIIPADITAQADEPAPGAGQPSTAKTGGSMLSTVLRGFAGAANDLAAASETK